MPQRGFLIANRQIPLEACLTDRHVTSRYPAQLLRTLFNKRNDQTPSASTLSGCMRRFELKRTTDYFVAPEASLPATFGTALHALLATTVHDDGVLLEHSMSRPITLDLPAPFDAVTVSGTADYIDQERRLIRDWKTKRYLPTGFIPPVAHLSQVAVYAWLWAQEHPEVPLREYEIVYLDQGSVFVTRGKLFDLHATEQYLRAALMRWAGPVSRGALPTPIDDFYRSDDLPRGECAYCEVRAQCQREWNRGRGE